LLAAPLPDRAPPAKRWHPGGASDRHRDPRPRDPASARHRDRHLRPAHGPSQRAGRARHRAGLLHDARPGEGLRSDRRHHRAFSQNPDRRSLTERSHLDARNVTPGRIESRQLGWPAVSSGQWWRDGVIYQIYVRSFQDSNGDGIGDLPGVIRRLDYLQWLGVDAIWLSPITVSPDADYGYDVADYCNVQPAFGELGDVDRLIREAAERGIRVILDIVPNHSSDRHPWFTDARSGRGARHRDWYVWANPKADGGYPNNWVSAFGGPAWTRDEHTGQYYLHNFLAQQPDFNWWNSEVADAFDEIYRFWFDRGVAGFRIDVAHGIVKDRELRDNPLATKDDPPDVRALGQRMVYNIDRPEVHDVLRHWRTLADRYQPPRILLGETYVIDVRTMGRFYGNVEDQQADPGSILSFVRDLIALRRTSPDLQAGQYRQLTSPGDTWAWQRGDATVVAVNLSGRRLFVPDLAGRVLISTTRSRDGERLHDGIVLGPWEGAICFSASTSAPVR